MIECSLSCIKKERGYDNKEENDVRLSFIYVLSIYLFIGWLVSVEVITKASPGLTARLPLDPASSTTPRPVHINKRKATLPIN